MRCVIGRRTALVLFTLVALSHAGLFDHDYHVTSLTPETYLAITTNASAGFHIIMMYAPWCGHCQQFAPKWSKVAQTLATEERVHVAAIDCIKYSDLCNGEGIKVYPTLKAFHPVTTNEGGQACTSSDGCASSTCCVIDRKNGGKGDPETPQFYIDWVKSHLPVNMNSNPETDFEETEFPDIGATADQDEAKPPPFMKVDLDALSGLSLTVRRHGLTCSLPCRCAR